MSALSPKVKLLKKEGEYLEFLLEGVTPAIANSIRRAILSEVPTLAIDEVVILENTSVLFDEILAHRLALIPLKVDPQTYDVLRECYEEGRADECRVALTLQVEALDRPLTVYSSHLKVHGVIGGIEVVKPEIAPVSDKIPIVKLERGQRIELEAFAKMGVGREHAKWQPVSVAAYKYKPIIEVPEEPCAEGCGKCVEACPKRILKVENGRVIVTDPLKCSLCRSCVEVCPRGLIKVFGDPTSFVFKVEGLGVIPVEKVVDTAIDVLQKRLSRLCEKICEVAKEAG